MLELHALRLTFLSLMACLALAAAAAAPRPANAAAGRITSTSPHPPRALAAVAQPQTTASLSAYPTITFDDVPLGSYVSSDYESDGVVFTSTVKTSNDQSNPTSPVLSGEPTFEGPIEGSFVNPQSGLPDTVASFTLDVGYINNRDSVVVEAYDAAGEMVQSKVADDFGINTLTLTYERMASFSVHEVTDEPAGFAIDNLWIDPTGEPTSIASVASMGDSYSSGQGLLTDEGLYYDCGTDLEAGLYYQDTTLPFLLARPWETPDCDTRSLSSAEPNLLTRPPVFYENNCHRHGLAYPVQIASMLHAAKSIFVACSGATTANIGEIPSSAKAQYPHSPVNVAGGNTQVTDVMNFRQQRLANQDPELLTIGIGGNDADFAGIARRCIVTIHPCSSDEDFVASVRNKITGPVYNKLTETFEGLRADFPAATIVAFGYPSPVSADTPSCNGAPRTVDREYLDDTVLPELNQAIADAADAAGISYVDVSRVTLGHEVCSADPWFRGLSYPIVQSFHPTQIAHDAIARYFREHYTDGQGNLLISNPQFPGDPIAPTQYGVAGAIATLSGGPRAACGPGCLQAVPCVQSCAVIIQGSGYSPQAQLEAVLHSTPYDLGPLKADAEGNVEGTVEIPGGVAPGPHVITVDGVAPDGTPQYGTLGIDVAESAPPSEPARAPVSPGPSPRGHAATSVHRAPVRAHVTLRRHRQRLIASVSCPRSARSDCVVTLILRRTLRTRAHARVRVLRTLHLHVGVGRTRRIAVSGRATTSAQSRMSVLVTTSTRDGRATQSLAVPK